ncbi:MAG: zinc ribbon domain-containing protein [Myxococcota bacterium]
MTPTLFAQLLAVSAASGTRASLTLLCMAVAARVTEFALPDALAFLVTDMGLALLVAVVVLDELVERDPQLQELLVFANVGVRGAAGAIAAWGLEDAVGSVLPDVGVWVVGACVAMAIHGLRMKVAVWIPDGGEGWLNPRTWLGWLEVGGVLGIVVAVFLAPFLALAIVVVATVLGAIAWQAGRQLEQTRRRRPCPHCGAKAREEASRCPSCHQPLNITHWLTP